MSVCGILGEQYPSIVVGKTVDRGPEYCQTVLARNMKTHKASRRRPPCNILSVENTISPSIHVHPYLVIHSSRYYLIARPFIIIIIITPEVHWSRRGRIIFRFFFFLSNL